MNHLMDMKVDIEKSGLEQQMALKMSDFDKERLSYAQINAEMPWIRGDPAGLGRPGATKLDPNKSRILL